MRGRLAKQWSGYVGIGSSPHEIRAVTSFENRGNWGKNKGGYFAHRLFPELAVVSG